MMNDMEALVEYSIFDDNGDVYKTFVRLEDVARLDNDQHHRFRLLKKLMENGQKPFGKWSASLGDAASGARKGTGASWPGKTANLFLAYCKAHRQVLRCKQVPLSMWETVSSELKSVEVEYSPEQLREKMRNLKRQFSECKKGKHGGSSWHLFNVMHYLFDAPLLNESSSNQLADDLGCIELGEVSSSNTDISNANGAGPSQIDDNNDIVTDTPAPWDESGFPSDTQGPRDDNEIQVDSQRGTTTVTRIGDTPGIATMLRQETTLMNMTRSTKPCQLDMLQSPPRKVGSMGPVHSDSKKKTPKRKVAAAALVWPQEHVHELMELCKVYKDQVQKANIPIKVWHEIHQKLNEKGIFIGQWGTIRAKFTQMNEYFQNTLLQVRGVMGGVLWPYYHSFCFIHDIPRDYTPVNHDEPVAKEGSIWVATAEELLISEYDARKDQFKSTQSGIRTDQLYGEIAAELRNYGVPATAKEARSHMEKIISQFKAEYDRVHKSGAGPSSQCHYEALLSIFNGTATLEPPCAVSVGRGLTYSVQGQAVKTTGSERKQKTYAFKSAASVSNLQARQLEQRNEMLHELRMLREAGEARSEARMKMLGETLECLKALFQQKSSNDV